MGVLKLANNASSTLAGDLAASDTTLSVQSADAAKFPTFSAGDWCMATLVDASANREIVKVTARATAVLTISRAQEGTTARAFAAGCRVECRVTAGILADLQVLNGIPDAAMARANLALDEIDNTADADKPVSTAQQAAIDAVLGTANNNIAAAKLGLAKRDTVRVMDTTDSDPATSGYTNGASVDSVTMATGETVLRNSTSHPERNGIWTVAASGAAARAEFFDTFDELPGALISVQEGSAADTFWNCTVNAGGTLNTDAITFQQVKVVVAATESVAGIMQLASEAEALAGTDTAKAMTAATTLAAIAAGDADKLDGQEGSYYQSASNINAGTLADARLSAAMQSLLAIEAGAVATYSLAFRTGSVNMAFGDTTSGSNLRATNSDDAPVLGATLSGIWRLTGDIGGGAGDINVSTFGRIS